MLKFLLESYRKHHKRKKKNKNEPTNRVCKQSAQNALFSSKAHFSVQLSLCSSPSCTALVLCVHMMSCPKNRTNQKLMDTFLECRYTYITWRCYVLGCFIFKTVSLLSDLSVILEIQFIAWYYYYLLRTPRKETII